MVQGSGAVGERVGTAVGSCVGNSVGTLDGRGVLRSTPVLRRVQT